MRTRPLIVRQYVGTSGTRGRGALFAGHLLRYESLVIATGDSHQGRRRGETAFVVPAYPTYPPYQAYPLCYDLPPMRIALGADHAGVALKDDIKKLLAERGDSFTDFGTTSTESVDYPD